MFVIPSVILINPLLANQSLKMLVLILFVQLNLLVLVLFVQLNPLAIIISIPVREGKPICGNVRLSESVITSNFCQNKAISISDVPSSKAVRLVLFVHKNNCNL